MLGILITLYHHLSLFNIRNLCYTLFTKNSLKFQNYFQKETFMDKYKDKTLPVAERIADLI